MSTTTFNDSYLPAGSTIVEAETYDTPSTKVASLTDPRGEAAEQYRLLRYRLECLARSGHKALAFTSAQSGEGKTTTAVNVALALSRGGQNRVVLVDADLRHPAVHEMLGLHAREGLCDVVLGRAELDACLWRCGSEALYVLPAGKGSDEPGTLYRPQFAELMAELKSRFDYVIVDVPPVLRLADVPIICRELDGAILIVRAGVTPREWVGAAIDALVDIPVHGVVLNGVDDDAPVTYSSLTPRPMAALPALAPMSGNESTCSLRSG